MNAAAPVPGKVPVSRLSSLAGAWLSPRRKRFWAIVLVLVYTLGGFFAVPALVKKLTVDAILDHTGRESTIGRVHFNPYVLSLEVNGFAVLDPDGEKLAGFEQLFVNLQLSSLFRWAWTLREVRLDGLYCLIERFAPGDTRFARLLASMEERSQPEPEAEMPGLPRFLVHALTLNEGRARFHDAVPSEAVDIEFGPVSVSVQELSTLPARSGQQSVKILLPNGSLLSWQGSVALGPLRSEGTLSLQGSHLEQTTIYLKAILPLQTLQATLSSSTNYRIEERADGSVAVELDGLAAQLSDVAVTGLAPATEFLAFRSLELLGGVLRYPENILQFSSVRVSQPRLEMWLDEQGRPSLSQLLPAGPPETNASQLATGDTPQNATGVVSTPAGGASPAWRLGVDEFLLSEGRLAFADRSIDPPASLNLQDIELTLKAISNEDNAEFPVSLAAALEGGGRLAFEGKLVALPALSARGTATAGAVPLPLAQPYVQQLLRVRVEAGTLDSTIDLTLRPDASVAATGSFTIAGLSVNDTVEQKPLIGWERLAIDRFETDTAAATLDVSQMEFRKPFGRLIINANQTTNLSGLMPGPTAEQTLPYAVVLGNISVRDGSLEFSDLSLPLPFATRIGALGGTISTIDSRSSEPATLRLEGQVDEYGLARISGGLNVLDPIRATDVKVEFRNLLMSSLSPYSIQFAGREIAEGKLDLDLLYRITDGRMQGQNDIVMRDLVLGDKVESPDAASLPLGLAVALLKDANGVIDIELPVDGDVDDPEFRIGGVIWQAFVGLVTKIVSAPFRLLGGLVGAESEDFGQFQFLAGRADLTPPELEKIGLLQRALQERPELSIEVAGGFVATIDTPALQYLRLRNEVLKRFGEETAPEGDEIPMLDERIRATLEAIHLERFPDTPLETVQAAHLAPPADDPESDTVLDQLAYTGDLRDRLLAAEEISEADLVALGNQRAEAIRTAFLASGEFAADRIASIAPAETESADGEWVLMELGLAAE